MQPGKQLPALTGALALGLVAAPGLARGDGVGFHTTTYGVEVEAVDLDGNPIGGGLDPLEVRFTYDGCCRLDIADSQHGHEFAEVWSPWASGRFEPISFPPDDAPRPCVGGVGHCSATIEMGDLMEMAGGQFLDAHVTALPGNLGAWNFNRFGTYWLKPGDSSTFSFRLNTELGNLAGRGHVLWVRNMVPEPATWVMLVAGFGLLGVALRRRADAARDGLAGDEPCAA